MTTENLKTFRRYKMSQHPLYHSSFDELVRRSPILNPKAPTSLKSAGNYMTDRSLIESMLYVYGADGSSQYRDEKGDLYNTVLAEMSQRVKEFEKQFEKQVQMALNRGDRRPSWPADLKEKKLRAESELDISAAEVDQLKQNLKNIKKTTEPQERIFPKGMKQNKLKFNSLGVLTSINGQKVSLNSEGILTIFDSRSPYDGLEVADYKYLSAQHNKIRRKLDKRKLLLMKKMKAQFASSEEIQAAWNVERQKFFEQKQPYKQYFVRLKINDGSGRYLTGPKLSSNMKRHKKPEATPDILPSEKKKKVSRLNLP